LGRRRALLPVLHGIEAEAEARGELVLRHAELPPDRPDVDRGGDVDAPARRIDLTAGDGYGVLEPSLDLVERALAHVIQVCPLLFGNGRFGCGGESGGLHDHARAECRRPMIPPYAFHFLATSLRGNSLPLRVHQPSPALSKKCPHIALRRSDVLYQFRIFAHLAKDIDQPAWSMSGRAQISHSAFDLTIPYDENSILTQLLK
jgi:hypothetical protein